MRKMISFWYFNYLKYEVNYFLELNGECFCRLNDYFVIFKLELFIRICFKGK